MKLRKIDEYRYCDDETGTYFQFPTTPAGYLTPEKAEEMILMDRKCFLQKNPAEDYFGTDRLVLSIGRVSPPEQEG